MRRFVLICSFFSFATLSFAQDSGAFFEPEFVTGNESEKERSVENVLEEISGIKAYSLGLIVNANKPNHYIKQIQSAIDTAAQNNLTLTQIIAVGLMPEGRESHHAGLLNRTAELFAIKALDGKLYPVQKIPELFNVKKSPTWIVNTKEGSILIEGKEEIWQFFNTKGEFIEKGVTPTKGIDDSVRKSTSKNRSQPRQ